MAYYVDTHCHLDLFPEIRQQVLQEDAAPIKTITVTNAPKFWQPNSNLFSNCKNIRVALGLHPELAIERLKELSVFEENITATRYIGEIGLDGTSKDAQVRNAQHIVFTTILKLLQNQASKILTVHSRAAASETVEELIELLRLGSHPVILHWYSGELEPLRRAVNAGFFFSVNHRMVSSKKGQAMLSNIPVKQILTETDAPFTFSDKVTNREDSLRETISGLSRIWKIEPVESKEIIWQNFKSLLNQANGSLNL
ncbi:TatD family hydrolase [Nibrella viscosa]|uniref:TatD family hydrolase n=1 Tax=Nibrella viscosa TaxID=1084524 RepID=A0ABP8KYZ8_9BACT